jgi:hypothetical protein
MFTRGFSRAFLLGILVPAGLFLLTGPAARAETSFHRLKRKLHQAERVAGEVIQRVGSMMEDGLSGMEIDFDLFDADSSSSCHAAKGERATSAPTHEPARAHHLTPRHPDHEKESSVHKHID